MWSAWLCSSYPLVHASEGAGPDGVLAFVLWSCVPLLLSALSLFPWCVGFEYGSVSRFKGVFSGFWGCCVGLSCLGALRGLWGFCVRERLGGLKACGVFAFVFLLVCLSFFSFCLCVCSSFMLFACFALVVLLSCLVLFVLVSLWSLLLFPFPLRTIRKKGRKGFALVPSLRVLCVFRYLCSY